jgi:hypothetical protein
MQAPAHHHAPDVVEAGQGVQPPDSARLKAGEGAFDPAGEVAQFLPCQVHQFEDRPGLHLVLHRLTAPIVALEGGRCVGGDGCIAQPTKVLDGRKEAGSGEVDGVRAV